MDDAFQWMQNNAICTESEYMYVSGTSGTEENCQSDCSPVENSRLSSYMNVNHDDASLMEALSQQPISVAIQADQLVFQFYRSGVMTGSCGTDINHGVLAVGYGNQGTNIIHHICDNSFK